MKTKEMIEPIELVNTRLVTKVGDTNDLVNIEGLGKYVSLDEYNRQHAEMQKTITSLSALKKASADDNMRLYTINHQLLAHVSAILDDLTRQGMPHTRERHEKTDMSLSLASVRAAAWRDLMEHDDWTPIFADSEIAYVIEDCVEQLVNRMIDAERALTVTTKWIEEE